jgi:hypothetical protein
MIRLAQPITFDAKAVPHFACGDPRMRGLARHYVPKGAPPEALDAA